MPSQEFERILAAPTPTEIESLKASVEDKITNIEEGFSETRQKLEEANLEGKLALFDGNTKVMGEALSSIRQAASLPVIS